LPYPATVSAQDIPRTCPQGSPRVKVISAATKIQLFKPNLHPFSGRSMAEPLPSKEVVGSVYHGNKKPPFAATSWLNTKPSDGLEPSTPSLPWRFRGGNGVHARAFATVFVLHICASQCVRRARACPGVYKLVYPPRTREALPLRKTDNGALAA